MDSLRSYTVSDPLHFERLEHRLPADDLLALVERRLGAVAPVDTAGIWARCLPRPMADLPGYGWKLHVSSRPADVTAVLAAVLDEYEVEPFNFKCVRDSVLALSQVARWWPRGGAGKAVTVYPESTGHALRLADRLSRRLAAFDGPYILSDRRYRDSRVVHYRYGTFRNGGGIDTDGHTVSEVTGPDGTVWCDDRTPKFDPPQWAGPDPFGPAVPDDSSGTGSDLLRRYRITGVLRHTTAGGVYAATGPDGRDVVIKEARPHTAVAPDGSDAVERLHREHRFLEKLVGTGIAPRPLELATVWEHTFLVQERMPGVTLQVWLGRNQPLAQGHFDAGTHATYRARVASLLTQLRTALATCLDHGVVYNDVSLGNMIVDDEDALRLIDFESGREVGGDPHRHQRTAGFAPAPGSPAWSDDDQWLRFGVAAVEAACLAPRNSLFALDPVAAGRSIAHAGRLVGWDTDGLLRILDTGVPGIRAATEPAPAPQSARVGRREPLRDDPATAPLDATDPGGIAVDIARHIRASATPERADRLFPADPELFRTNPLSVAWGAAGILRALRHLDGEVDPEHVTWVYRRLDVGRPLPPGLYVGSAGIAVALLETGCPDRAADLLESATIRAERDPDLPADVATGRAGIGLALLAAADLTGDPAYLDRAAAVARRLRHDAEDDGTGLWWAPKPGTTRSIGYLYGSSGVAGFLTALAVATDDRQHLRTARRALDHDLDRGQVRACGGLGYNAHVGAVAYEPYYSRGGSGVAMAAAALLAATGDDRLRELLPSMVRGLVTPITVQPGLFTGTTSIGEMLLDVRAVLPGTPYVDDGLRDLVAALCTLGRRTGQGIAVPGSGLARYSCDVATGSAGVALFLRRLADGTRTADLRHGRPLPGGTDGR
ncbi:class III lanthionine synthetase LanKC [Micromonospora sp. SH-82]|uniref:class III lanthionine synthetase LanKC n=1 Tax=Micromonospora sp. SH-82 TaxID=3132938 RepID=UPI003EBB3406